MFRFLRVAHATSGVSKACNSVFHAVKRSCSRLHWNTRFMFQFIFIFRVVHAACKTLVQPQPYVDAAIKTTSTDRGVDKCCSFALVASVLGAGILICEMFSKSATKTEQLKSYDYRSSTGAHAHERCDIAAVTLTIPWRERCGHAVLFLSKSNNFWYSDRKSTHTQSHSNFNLKLFYFNTTRSRLLCTKMLRIIILDCPERARANFAKENIFKFFKFSNLKKVNLKIRFKIRGHGLSGQSNQYFK